MASRTGSKSRSTSAGQRGSTTRGKTKQKPTKASLRPKTASAKGSTTTQPVNEYFELRRSEIQGQGAFAIRPIRRGTRIIEYVGERITPEEADRRYDDDGMGRHHTFLFSVDKRTVIDAAVDGNEARFINHSCAPNCEAIDEKKRIYIEAIRSISAGEELVYDYGYERDGTEDEDWERLYMCKCGAPTCRGTILAPLKKGAKGAKKSAKKSAKK